jgi:CHRD domain/Secretion system C-terminal sorting domain
MKNLNKLFLNCILILAVILFFQKPSSALIYTFNLGLFGNQEVPPNASTAVGNINGTFDDATDSLKFNLIFNGLLAPTTAAHFHAPADFGFNAPVIIPFNPDGFPVGVTSGAFSHSYVLDSAEKSWILGGLFYVNIHTTAFPGGEIRGQLVEGTLPVELSSFASSVLRNTVILKWSTVQESNNAGFDVERKLHSATGWAKVGNVLGNGTTKGIMNYTFSEQVSTGLYNYRLKQIDINGNYEYFPLQNEVNVGTPNSYNISQNYPNPFNPTTKIDYEIPYDGKVNILLYDLSGKEVASLVNETQTAGYYTAQLNAANLSSGTYFYRIFASSTNGNFVETKKLTLIK